jgi:5-bromo-4-chloroindolyl phosphate hydrolysis protein
MLASSSESVYNSLFTGVLILFIAGAVGAIILSFVRKRFASTTTEPAPDFSLSDLRKLHAAGQITDEEFERAKGKMVASAHEKIQKQVAKTKPPFEPIDPPTEPK